MRKSVFGLLLLATLLVGVHPAYALIDAALQMQLGNPSGATASATNHDHFLIQRAVEAIDYNDHLREPNWASWDLTAGDIGNSGRSPDFFADTSLPQGFYVVQPTDYSGSGFDRGHMCPSADRTDKTADNDLVFLMSNIIPQNSQNNQGVWGNFEDECRALAQAGNELLITCGPSGFNGSRTTSSGAIAIPAYTWKIAVVVPNGVGTALSRITTATRVIAIKIPNSNGVSSAWQNYVTSANQIQVDTGFTFFTALPENVAAVLRSKVDGQTAPPPGITSFSPGNGSAGTTVIIAGANFSGASTVTFNGVAASYSVDSATQITATVPTFATSGKISVTTPTGTSVSASPFSVTGTVLDLAIMVSHTGNFIQGEDGFVYTVTVANVGNVASTGSVMVTDVVPSGLNVTSISGSGWSFNQDSLSGTRTDALPPGASYPPMLVTVRVLTNVPLSVTNRVMLSGGGDTNSVNNTASDPTAIQSPADASGTNQITLMGWDVSGMSNFGISPLPPTTNSPLLTVTGLTRGSGVGASGSGAARGWGGNTFNSSSSAAAITAGQYATFSAAVGVENRVSYKSISNFDYRHSTTGPVNGLLQYQINGGLFADIGTVAYPSNTSTGGSLPPIDLSGAAALQNVGPGTNVTFRIVNWGGTSSAGTWYIFDVTNSIAVDFAVQGTVVPLNPPVADLTVSLTHAGNFTQADSGDSYTIIVTNAGAISTLGQVSLVCALPAGLKATSISGPGWTPNLNTLTCVRSDSLAVGEAYPPITLTVDVASNAPGSVVTFATVSGGGQTNTVNDMVGDPTTIVALTPIQQWRLQWFGATADAGESADTAVASLDGMPNLLKYAFGLNPLLPAPSPLVADTSTGFLRVTLPKNPAATDVSFRLETTADLIIPWTESQIIIDQNTANTLQAHFDTPISATVGGRFMRLRVSRP